MTAHPALGNERDNWRRSGGGVCCIGAYWTMALALAAAAVGLQWLAIALCVAVGVFTLGAVWLGRL